MRAGLGILALLIVMFISLYMWSSYMQVAAPIANHAQVQAQQFAGRDSSGANVTDALELKRIDKNNKFYGVLVNGIIMGSDIQTFYGLLPGDQIIEVQHLPFEALGIDSKSSAKDMILDMYEKHQPLTVIRGGQTIELPSTDKHLAPAPALPQMATPATPTTPSAVPASPLPAQPATPAPPPKSQQPTGGIAGQLEQIRQHEAEQGQ